MCVFNTIRKNRTLSLRNKLSCSGGLHGAGHKHATLCNRCAAPPVLGPRLPGVNVSPHSPQRAPLHGCVARVVTQGPTWKGPVLGLMLCHHHFEILGNFCTRGYTFSFCCGPFKRWWPVGAEGGGLQSCLILQPKRKNLRA